MSGKIIVVGCGVSGLTTAIELLEHGFQVEIRCGNLTAQTVSAKAAALWFPFQIGPMEEVNAWSKTSYLVFEQLANDPITGVRMRPHIELIQSEADAWWQSALPASRIRKADLAEMPAGFALGYRLEVPIIETPIYLQYLLDRFYALGGLLQQQHLSALAPLLEQCDIVVNCSGLGAKELVGDETVYPISGQIVKVNPNPAIESISADMALWNSETDLAYVIPRQDCIVLGGNVLKGRDSYEIDDQTTLGILERCTQLDARLAALPVLKVEVGLRPGRPSIRLEREGRIIHNYGHGGGGYTVSWGCAKAVLELILNEAHLHIQAIIS